MTPTPAHVTIWMIAILATAGVLIRPFKWPEAVWATAGAVLLVASGLLPVAAGVAAVEKGSDVYLFLIGMMLLSETARREGLFDWVAAHAVNRARGSRARLFLLVYGVGVVVTAFLSNDATAVVLTPAVFAAAGKAKADTLPYLLVCAFIANAASFVLPISNPANIVLYGDHTPPLWQWLRGFALPSAMSIGATYAALWWSQRKSLVDACERAVEQPLLSRGGRTALAGIGVTAVSLLAVSALDIKLGAPTAALGVAATLVVSIQKRESPWATLRGASWSVLPLVAGLFVIVEALNRGGLISALSGLLEAAVSASANGAAAAAGVILAVVSNIVNNLPAGLIASATIVRAQPPKPVIDALLIGVDLGPNLSVTGSLATILWLTAIRREGEEVGFGAFLKVGVIVMPPALILAIGARLLIG